MRAALISGMVDRGVTGTESSNVSPIAKPGLPVRKLTPPLLAIACSLAFLHDRRGQGMAPSIDRTGGSAVEGMVCRDAALVIADPAVEVYATASKAATSDQKNRLAADQQRWLNEARRLRHRARKRVRKGALSATDRRLQAQSSVPSRGPFQFVCNSNPGSVLVAQYFDTDPATARFAHDGRTVTAFIQRSGSGARYGGPSISYWEHQGEASVVWFGHPMKCATR
jgi:uncharacterized protein